MCSALLGDEPRGTFRKQLICESLAEGHGVLSGRFDFATSGQGLGAVEGAHRRVKMQSAANRGSQRAQWHLAATLQPSQECSLSRRSNSRRTIIQRAQPSQRLLIADTTGNSNDAL